MVRLTIDGREIETEPGYTILEAAREHGLPIPTLCYHEALEPFAACRMCVVEVETGRGRQLVASCAYPCADGLVVYTTSDAVLQSRRMTIELLMASAAHVPLIRDMAEELGVTTPRFSMEKDDCILCGLCVRACHEIVGVGAISVINRGIEKKVSPPFHIASNACITLADITGGVQTVHPWESEFEAVECRVCGHHYLAPQFADHATLLAEPDLAPSGRVEGEAVP
jgi:bidirectional [NiFe] hydrogenase diaphorase subunit